MEMPRGCNYRGASWCESHHSIHVSTVRKGMFLLQQYFTQINGCISGAGKCNQLTFCPAHNLKNLNHFFHSLNGPRMFLFFFTLYICSIMFQSVYRLFLLSKNQYVAPYKRTYLQVLLPCITKFGKYNFNWL